MSLTHIFEKASSLAYSLLDDSFCWHLWSRFSIQRGVSLHRSNWYTWEVENIIKKTMRLLSILLGIGAIVMFVLASVLNLSIGWIGLVMLVVAAVVALMIAFIESLLMDMRVTTLAPTEYPRYKPFADTAGQQEVHSD